MAKLLLLNETSDVVAFYRDDQLLGSKEQQLVDSNFFKVVEMPDKTVEQLRLEANAVHPEIKEVWIDKATGEMKVLESRPRYSMKYENGSFVATIPLQETNQVLANKTVIDAIKAVEPIGEIER